MLRSITALSFSILLHVFVISGLTMPTPVISRSDAILVHLRPVEIIQDEQVQALPEVPQGVVTNTVTEPSGNSGLQNVEEAIEEDITHPEDPSGDDIDEIPEGISQSDIGTEDNDSETDGGSEITEYAGQGGEPLPDSVNNGPSDVDEHNDGAANDTEESLQTVDTDAVREEYRRRVLSVIEGHRVYPQAARRLGREGTVTVRFTVTAGGAVSGISIVASSGTDSLDNAAADAVRSSSPLPPIPDELGTDSLTLSIEIIFELN